MLLSLSGHWNSSFGDVVLPGSLDSNQKGNKNENHALDHLSRKYDYTGTVKFEKTITLSQDWLDKKTKLFLERTRPSKLWINNNYIGSYNVLTVPHIYDITNAIKLGENVITIEIDNSYDAMPKKAITESHMATEHTQTNWNGILGKIELQAFDQINIENVRVYPDIDKKTANIKIEFDNRTNIAQSVKLTIDAKSFNNETSQNIKAQYFDILVKPELSSYELTYDMGETIELWDEFSPTLYALTIQMSCNQNSQTVNTNFGMRNFSISENKKQFTINNKITFLRSEANCAVFPLTGYAPMDETSWEKLFKTYKSFGVNHVRFHSWCPPDAAFTIADKMGIYLQPELCQWSFDTFESDSDYGYFKAEMEDTLKCYANHPSFVAYTWGNELSSKRRDRMTDLIHYAKTIDHTRLYAEGSNTWYGNEGVNEASDFVTTQALYDFKQLFRGSFAGNKGHVNSNIPGTMVDYEHDLEGINMPLFSFECGQYQVSPDFREIPEYTGVLEARNLKVFKDDLEKNNMLDLANDFFNASGELSKLCYKEEIEAAIRTNNFAGISLLGIQDFPGQSTALVGMINALGQVKDFIKPAEFKRFFNYIVPLARMEKLVWKNNEVFSFKFQVANYGPEDITVNPYWCIKDTNGNNIYNSKLQEIKVAQGKIFDAADITYCLENINTPSKIILEIGLDGTVFVNTYDLWVYSDSNIDYGDTLVVNELHAEAINKLNSGGKVLFIPNKQLNIMDKTIKGTFIPDFWCWCIFKKEGQAGTLGLLIENKHSVFDKFPTEFHSNWQWWSLATSASPMNLTGTHIKPLVQTIDNFSRNQKLGILFEAKVGNGKLMVSSMDLLSQNIEAKQLLSSILGYMNSNQFNPSINIDTDFLKISKEEN